MRLPAITRSENAPGRARILSLALFAQVPLIFLGFWLWLIAFRGDHVMQDFAALRNAGRLVLAGTSPYPPVEATAIAHAHDLVYPPVIAYAFVPFALLPGQVAAAVYLALIVAAVPLTLFVLGIRDWRCYGAAFLWPATLGVFGVGALGSLLALGTAVAWRIRGRLFVSAALVAFVVVAKIFLWPLVVWLAATRRWATAALACVLAAAATAVAFVPIGVDAARDYPRLVRLLADIFEPESFSTSALLLSFDLPDGAVRGAVLALVIGVVAATFALARRDDGDRRAFAFALCGSLLLSPIVWLHYYVLLLVPVALARPRLSPLWLAPLALWLSPDLEARGDVWRIVLGLGLVLATSAYATGRRSSDIAMAPLRSSSPSAS